MSLWLLSLMRCVKASGDILYQSIERPGFPRRWAISSRVRPRAELLFFGLDRKYEAFAAHIPATRRGDERNTGSGQSAVLRRGCGRRLSAARSPGGARDSGIYVQLLHPSARTGGGLRSG